MLILSLQPSDRLDPSMQSLDWLADLLMGWLDAILYWSFDIGFGRVFSAVSISIFGPPPGGNLNNRVNKAESNHREISKTKI